MPKSKLYYTHRLNCIKESIKAHEKAQAIAKRIGLDFNPTALDVWLNEFAKVSTEYRQTYNS